MYLTQKRRSQIPVSQIIDDYASITSEDELTQARPASQSYKLVKVRGADGNIMTIRRNLPTPGIGEVQDGVATTSTPTASKGACRFVNARSSDGSFMRVQRPVRDSELFMGIHSRASGREPMPRNESVRSSSIYHDDVDDDDASRDTMISTMTLVETALAEQQAYQRSGGAQRLGHSANRSSATGVSGSSGNIEIGHIDENDEIGRSRRYSVSEYGDFDDHTAQFEGNDRLTIRRSRSAHESYNTSDARAAFRPAASVTVPTPLPAIRYSDLPSTSPAVRYSDDSHTSTRYTDKLRDQARDVYLGTSTEEAAMRPWLQRLVRLCSYILASCSIALPVAFIALGIVAILIRGQSVSSKWSVVADLVEVAAAIWPIAFATIVAQCFKAGIIFRRSSGSGRRITDCKKRSCALHRLEALCLLVFLIWCLSPIGPLAARHMYDTTREAVQGQSDVLYIDKTGQNQIWAPTSDNTLSSTSRSELIQTIGARYMRSLSQDNVNNPGNEPMSTYSPPEFTSMDSIVSEIGSTEAAGLPHGIRSRSGMVDNTHDGVSIAAEFETLKFSMTASAFEFKCGDWTLMKRRLGNGTSSDQISYSASQTLGLSMPGHDDSTASPTVRLVSLNRKSTSNTTTLRRRRRDTSPQAVDQWEYSSISCSYEQVFYNVPVRCSRDNSTGLTTCTQSAASQPIPYDDALNTPLGDFALDFVWSGNLPTTEMAATATERYIQRGGPSDIISLTSMREVSNAKFNLSATVTPDEFAQRFGQLFSTWVGLGYCPQCSSGIVVNGTAIPANLQPHYRTTSSTVTWSGEQTFTVNWAWLAVFIVSTSILLVAAIGAIVVETIVTAKTARENTVSRATLISNPSPMRLPTMYSTMSDGQSSPQWGKAVMQDMDVAAGVGYSRTMYN